jgi:hypothetical protein
METIIGSQSALFKTGWFSFELPGYRPCHGTYELYPYDGIPPISQEQLTGQLQWLVPLASEIDAEMQPHRSTPEQREEHLPELTDDVKSLVASAESLGLTLPEAFLRLMSSSALQDRIPSCTACYFQFSRLAPCPGDKEGGYVLRFLHDQQDCIIWHLYLSPKGDAYVLASYTYLDLAGTDSEEVDHITEADAVKYTWVCAPSFEAFLYRFWLENVIWFNLAEQKPLLEEQKQYLAFYENKKLEL